MPELSVTEGLCSSEGNTEIVARLQTVIQHTKDYLKCLALYGHNIVHSVPIFTPGCGSIPLGLTSVSYRVVTKTDVTIRTCGHVHKASEAPVILIHGMCGFRPMPSIHVTWIPGWVICGKGNKSVGTVALSRELFLERWLLPKLSAVNSITTVIPKFAGVINGEWHFELTNWAQHEYHSGKDCNWKREGKHQDYLAYVWEHREDWNHEHKGTSSGEKKGEYSISCEYYFSFTRELF